MRGLFGAVAIAAVALATVFSGQRYLYCRPMGQIMTRATCECAQRDANERREPALSVLNDCFDVRFLDRLASTTSTANLDVAAAPLLAVLPAGVLQLPPSKSAVARADHPIRAGPHSPAALRARLMVFLT